MSKKENVKNENSGLQWLTTSADIKVVVKDNKVMFFIEKTGQAFSYSLNFFKKIIENSKQS
jgi:hypothetical protein